MSFPHNSLPSEFEQDHGTIDLEDSKPEPAYGGEDEDLILDDLGQRIWLVKIPKFLMEKWSNVQEEGVVLGRVRVYDEKDSNGDPKIAVILEPTATDPNPNPTLIQPSTSNQPSPSDSSDSYSPISSLKSTSLKSRFASSGPSAPIKSRSIGGLAGRANAGASGSGSGLPSEYKLTLQNTATKNMFVFGEKEEEVEDSGEVGARKRRRVTQILGTVHHECVLTPSISSLEASSSYQTIMRDRFKKASEPKRTIKTLDHLDRGISNQLAAGARLGTFKAGSNLFVKPKISAATNPDLKTSRMPRNELLDLLFKLFESHPYWQLKSLTEHLKQPQSYLKEVLNDVAKLVPKGPYVNMWTLKEEFKTEGMGMAVHRKVVEEVGTEGSGAGGSGEGEIKREEVKDFGGRKVIMDELDDGDDLEDDMEEVEIIEN